MTSQLSLSVVNSLQEVSATAWQTLVLDTATRLGSPQDLGCDPQNPFISHEFLSALERTGCAAPAAGWYPAHILMHRGEQLVGAAPAYLKTNSQGEYVFDHAWADAFERAGGEYYPKLQCATPFTPVSAPRLLVAHTENHQEIEALLLAALKELAHANDASSLHLTFLPEPQRHSLAAHGLLQRNDQQFHWCNSGYTHFDSFLAALASRKRKAIRKERQSIIEAGVKISWLRGRDISDKHWQCFFELYQHTGNRKWGRPYLNQAFFAALAEQMPHACLLIYAEQNGAPLAAALNMIGETTLYGRYWGAYSFVPHLHFELCYYQAIDYAIQHGLQRVEAGAQGEHKLARGYEPVTTYSAHHISHKGLRDAVAHYLQHERQVVAHNKQILEQHSPFKQTDLASKPHKQSEANSAPHLTGDNDDIDKL
ncbi:GNAT family N-acetyltransferase [Polycladidibacter hongkongensis]|uniref:GNAT family N-acetyltransferase n=1 Tax=Polycladidibacter hongkongensis TaxID=1647556 RepID=UPI0009EC3E6D|nr:GNAT family N-acetyltransferase [Pseudovibrio hongkongensis]